MTENTAPTLFALTNDSEIATVKAALDTADDFWASALDRVNDTPVNARYRKMVQEQLDAIRAIAQRIEQEAW